MTTIVVHGTIAANEEWYWNSWYEGGFCQNLSKAMLEHSDCHDVWRVADTHVSEVKELNPKRSWWKTNFGQLSQQNGHFIWSGDYVATARKFAAKKFAQYLNVIASVTDEPIRIVAHSHGCNVVKAASSYKKLNSSVYIEKAAFLACPHFFEPDYQQKNAFTLKLKVIGNRYLYALQPERFGRIANFYSTRDPVVGKLSNKFATPSGLGFEVPNVSFVDNDPRATSIYENYEVDIPDDVKASAIHGWLHNQQMAYTVGRWFETGKL